MIAAGISPRSQKLLMCVSLALAGVYAFAYVFLLDFWPPPPPTLSADQIVALYAHANLKFRLGCALMIFSGGFFLPWSVVVGAQMSRLEKGLPVWAILQIATSTIGSWLIAFPPVFWGIAAFSTNRDPAVTMLMNEFAWLIFTSPVSFWPFQMLSITAVALSDQSHVKNSAFPRWIGWLAAWTALGGTLGGMSQVLKTGPFAWNGLFSFYFPVFFTLALVAALAFTMFRAIGRQQKAAAALL